MTESKTAEKDKDLALRNEHSWVPLIHSEVQMSLFLWWYLEYVLNLQNVYLFFFPFWVFVRLQIFLEYLVLQQPYLLPGNLLALGLWGLSSELKYLTPALCRPARSLKLSKHLPSLLLLCRYSIPVSPLARGWYHLLTLCLGRPMEGLCLHFATQFVLSGKSKKYILLAPFNWLRILVSSVTSSFIQLAVTVVVG